VTKKKQFKTIGLIGRIRSSGTAETLTEIMHLLKKHGFDYIMEYETSLLFDSVACPALPKEEFAKECDIAIVVGGDGSILHAARVVVEHHLPVMGINRGRLGFLTDIYPQDTQTKILAILHGEYIEEQRFLLNAKIQHQNQIDYHEVALNDVVLLPGEYAHMIEFEIYINQQLVCQQRADGQIIATPTGSTAYALSGGGPILHPALEAVVLVPMFSHTLSSRPIVVESRSAIEIRIPEFNETSPFVSCDGLTRVAIKPGSSLHITRHKKTLKLLHPKDYQYFETLRTKLHWQTPL
jgi:NAD+ kinase